MKKLSVGLAKGTGRLARNVAINSGRALRNATIGPKGYWTPRAVGRRAAHAMFGNAASLFQDPNRRFDKYGGFYDKSSKTQPQPQQSRVSAKDVKGITDAVVYSTTQILTSVDRLGKNMTDGFETISEEYSHSSERMKERLDNILGVLSNMGRSSQGSPQRGSDGGGSQALGKGGNSLTALLAGGIGGALASGLMSSAAATDNTPKDIENTIPQPTAKKTEDRLKPGDDPAQKTKEAKSSVEQSLRNAETAREPVQYQHIKARDIDFKADTIVFAVDKIKGLEDLLGQGGGGEGTSGKIRQIGGANGPGGGGYAQDGTPLDTNGNPYVGPFSGSGVGTGGFGQRGNRENRGNGPSAPPPSPIYGGDTKSQTNTPGYGPGIQGTPQQGTPAQGNPGEPGYVPASSDYKPAQSGFVGTGGPISSPGADAIPGQKPDVGVGRSGFQPGSGAVGLPTGGGFAPGPAAAPEKMSGGIDRSQFADAAKDPNLQYKLAWMVKGEIGSLDKDPTKALIQLESHFNRTQSRASEGRGYNLSTDLKTSGEGGYYAGGARGTFREGAKPSDAEMEYFRKNVLGPVMAGSDESTKFLGKPSTGNASGNYAQNRLNQGIYDTGKWYKNDPNNEMYVTERRDAKNMAKNPLPRLKTTDDQPANQTQNVKPSDAAVDPSAFQSNKTEMPKQGSLSTQGGPITRPDASKYASGERLFYNQGNMKGVDPRLVNSLQAATKDLPPGFHAEIVSGHDSRSTGTTNHPSGIAMDIKLYDANGKYIPFDNATSSPGVQHYEKLAQSMNMRGKEMYPGTDWLWGGTWRGGAAPKEGDPMHYQVFTPGVGSQGMHYNWQKGATDKSSFPYFMNDQQRADYQKQIQQNIQNEKVPPAPINNANVMPGQEMKEGVSQTSPTTPAVPPPSAPPMEPLPPPDTSVSPQDTTGTFPPGAGPGDTYRQPDYDAYSASQNNAQAPEPPPDQGPAPSSTPDSPGPEGGTNTSTNNQQKDVDMPATTAAKDSQRENVGGLGGKDDAPSGSGNGTD